MQAGEKTILLFVKVSSDRMVLFLISLTEHKSVVDYDVAMQLLKYMLCIWLEYGKEMEQQNAGISGRKIFRYPAIIPVVYYEGKKAWTADRHFRGRIAKGNLFQDWIPDFCYEVVRIHDYSNEELAKKAKESEHITIKSIVSVCRKHGISKEEAISEVMDNCELDRETAEEKVNQQWET